MKKYRIISLLMASCLLFSGCVDGNTDDRGSSYNEDDDKGKDKDKDKDDDEGGFWDRYSAQKAYTTLQDAAVTIKNCANNASSDANQIGAFLGGEVSGKVTGGDLELTLTGKAAIGADDDYKAHWETSDTTALRFAKSLYAALANILPNGSSFYIKLDKSTVYGVIYSADPSNVITKEVTVYIVEGYDYAFEDAKRNPIGVSGEYVPK